jgi:hypothetical protein
MMDQDERAYVLIDRLFMGQAQRLPYVISEFKRAGIPGWDEYLIAADVHITKDEIDGSRWVYRWHVQLKRLRSEIEAEEFVAKVDMMYLGDWENVPLSTFDVKKGATFKSLLGKRLIARNIYIVGEDSDWDKFRNNGNGHFEVLGKELTLSNRNWMFEELEAVDLDEDPEVIWQENAFVWEDRVTKDEFMRCFDLADMYETTDVKRIFRVESPDGY